MSMNRKVEIKMKSMVEVRVCVVVNDREDTISKYTRRSPTHLSHMGKTNKTHASMIIYQQTAIVKLTF